MRYSLFIYKTDLEKYNENVLSVCSEAVADPHAYQWGHGAGTWLRRFDTDDLAEKMEALLGDKCRCRLLQAPEPYTLSYLGVYTTYEEAPTVLPVLHMLCAERDLVLFDAEQKKTFFRDLVDVAFLQCRMRAEAIKQVVLSRMQPVWSYRSLGHSGEYLRRYVVTLRKDGQKPFYLRCEEFHDCLVSSLESGEELVCEKGYFRIVSRRYEIVLCLEGYKKQSDIIGWYENGRPRAEKAGRMGCEQGFRWVRDNLNLPERVFQRMNFREMIEKYPNPADRFVAAVKISKWEQKQDYGVSYRGIGPYGAEMLFHVVPEDYDDPASFSMLAIEEFDAEPILRFLQEAYPYFYQRYYLDANHIPYQMMADIVDNIEQALQTAKPDSISKQQIGLLKAFVQWADRQLCIYDDGIMFNIQGP